jgi:hypothetical protein
MPVLRDIYSLGELPASELDSRRARKPPNADKLRTFWL